MDPTPRKRVKFTVPNPEQASDADIARAVATLGPRHTLSPEDALRTLWPSAVLRRDYSGRTGVFFPRGPDVLDIERAVVLGRFVPLSTR